VIRYLDTSVVMKTLVTESDSSAVVASLDRGHDGASDVSSSLLVTELHRAGRRSGIAPDEVDRALGLLELVRVSDALLRGAAELPGPSLRSLDAVHIATALEIEADVFLTADVRQADAARDVGLVVVDRFG